MPVLPIRFLLFTLVLIASVPCTAQRGKMYYKTTEDSLRYEALFQELMLSGPLTSVKTFDSLRLLMNEMGATGRVRQAYSPRPTFTPLKSLLDGSVKAGEIRNLSITLYKKKKLPREVFRCSNLRQLEITESYISRFPRRLRRLGNMTHLYVYGYRGSQKLRFAKNESVTTLHIRSAEPGVVPKDFGRLKTLDTLDLQENRLRVFPGIVNNAALTELNLSRNEIDLRTIDPRPNPVLKHLIVQRNGIKEIPGAVASLRGLKKLVFNYNEISAVSNQLGELKDLEVLSFYSNKLTAIPPAVYRLPNLKIVDLYFNEIERVGDSIANLQNLEILYLASNRIFSLSSRIGELTKLEELYVHHNRLSILPEEIARLKKLHTLRFNANHMVEVPEWLYSLSLLRNVDISQNKISESPLKLAMLPSLEIASMSENPWDKPEEIRALADELEKKGVVVHVNE